MLQFFFVCAKVCTMKTIKQQIADYLTKEERPAAYLAQKAGISPSILSLFLSGKRGMTISTWEKILKVISR